MTDTKWELAEELQALEECLLELSELKEALGNLPEGSVSYQKRAAMEARMLLLEEQVRVAMEQLQRKLVSGESGQWVKGQYKNGGIYPENWNIPEKNNQEYVKNTLLN